MEAHISYSNTADAFDNYHLQSARLTRAHTIEQGTTIMLVSSVMVISPLISHFLTRKYIAVGPQLVAMILGMITAIVTTYCDPITSLKMSPFSMLSKINPYTVLSIYYPTLLLKFIYSLDSYVFCRAVWHILVISIFGWAIFVVCFGFLLITFAGELTALSVQKLLMVGIVFAPVEMPSELFNIMQLKSLEVVINGESILTSILSLTTLPLLLGDVDGMFVYWYQPLAVLLRLSIVALIIGLPLGFLAGYLFPKTCTNSSHMMIMITACIYLLYNVCKFLAYCSTGLVCFIVLIFISRNRVNIPAHIDKEIIQMIDMLFACVSIAVSYIIVLQTLPHFLDSFNGMGAAISAALYICANVYRFVFFIAMSPILSRLGYSYNFKTMLTMVWCIRKGPVSFIMLAVTVAEGFGKIVPHYLLHLGLNYLFLMNLLNEFTAWTMLKKLGVMGDDLVTHRAHMKDSLKHIKQRRNNQLAALRMNRFYSAANWTVINDVTTICRNVNPDDEVDGSSAYGMKFEKQPPYCIGCKRVVAYEPTAKECMEALNVVKLRVLHATRVSFVRQFETGFVDIVGLRTLINAFETAIETKTYTLRIDELLALMRKKDRNKFFEKLRLFIFWRKKATKGSFRPRYPKWSILMRHWAFMLFFDLLAIAYFIFSIVDIVEHGHSNNLMMDITNAVVYLLYALEFVIKVIGNVQVTGCDGFRRYIKSPLNMIDFGLIVLGLIDIIFNAIIVIFKNAVEIDGSSSVQKAWSWVIGASDLLCLTRLARIVRLLRLLSKLQLAIVAHYDKHIDAKVNQFYSVGKAIAISYEEVDDMLHFISTDEAVIEPVRAQLQADRNLLVRELGMIEMQRPWVTMGMKTRQAMTCALKTMDSSVSQLRVAGLIDDHEFAILHYVIVERWKVIHVMKSIANVAPHSVFYEVPWLANDEQTIELLYENVGLRVWDVGDVICTRGDVGEGIIIIVTGMFKVTYHPDEEALALLVTNGLLPVKDMIGHTRFNSPMVEYILKGNSIGELSVMTGRPYSCDIVVETPSQAFVLPRKYIVEALKLSKDPLNGLYSRIWLHISTSLVKRLLLDTPLYSSMSYDQLNLVISRCFMPRLDAYNVLSLTEYIEDVVLIEGTVVDYTTREIYVAPCYIPRGLSKLIIPDNENHGYMLTVKPKICLIPLKDVDEYEVMMYSELISEIEQDVSSSCFLGRNFAFRKWQKRRKGRTARSTTSRRSIVNSMGSLGTSLTFSRSKEESSSKGGMDQRLTENTSRSVAKSKLIDTQISSSNSEISHIFYDVK